MIDHTLKLDFLDYDEMEWLARFLLKWNQLPQILLFWGVIENRLS